MKLVNVGIASIDSKRAQELLDMYPYERQRKIGWSTVNYYAQMMSEGKWLSGTEIDIAFAPNGDGTKHGYLINGQHRLRAVIEAQSLIEVVLKEYDCANKDEVAEIYGMLDTGRKRTINDYVNALGVTDELGLSATLIHRLAGATVVIEAGFKHSEGKTLTPTRRLELLYEYSPYAIEYFASMNRNNTVINPMRRAAVMAVALTTLKESRLVYGENKVMDFWIGTALDDGLRLNDPRKVANKHIFNSTVKGGNPNRKVVSTAYRARYVANCFNAWVEDRTMTFARVADANAPIFIAGTQYKG